MQLILESAGPGFTAACTQLEGLRLSARNHGGERTLPKTQSAQPDAILDSHTGALFCFSWLQIYKLPDSTSQFKGVTKQIQMVSSAQYTGRIYLINILKGKNKFLLAHKKSLRLCIKTEQ